MAQPADSIYLEHQFKAKQLIAPAALLTVGAVGVALPDVRHHMQDKLGREGTKYEFTDDVLRYLPCAANVFLGFGVKGKHKFGDRVMITATAFVIENALVFGTKHLVHELRPDGSDKKSFPSGHTADAFLGAELLRQEYGWHAGLAGYAVATATGCLRVYRNRHWVSDVLAGAGVGILSANIANWLYPVERRWFTPKSKRKSGTGASYMVVPSYEPTYNTVGVALNATF